MDMLVILDIDETLVHSSESAPPDGCDLISCGLFVQKRPFVDEFIQVLKQNFLVAVWTSSVPEYSTVILEHLGLADGIEFSWSRERCTLRTDLEAGESLWLKKLKKIRKAGYSLERTVMIDDSPEALGHNYGNLIRVKPFTGQSDDRELLNLLPYLKWLSKIENVRKIDKRKWRTHSSRSIL